MKAICRPLNAVLLVLTGLAVAGAAGQDAPIVPHTVIKLFNGRDLSGWTTWLVDAKRQDPRGVYSVRDEMIRMSGDGWVPEHRSGVQRLPASGGVEVGDAELPHPQRHGPRLRHIPAQRGARWSQL